MITFFNSKSNILKFAILIHIIMAIFSVGFHQFDEHFQILEFLNFKLYNGPEKDLAWEYKEQIRPWFQVFIYYCLVYPFKYLGLTSPYIITWLLKTITGLFGLYCAWSLKDYLRKFFSEEKVNFGLFFLTVFWFIPYIHVRTSAESLSLAFMLLGFSFFHNVFDRKSITLCFVTGLILSFSYLAKAQGAIPVAFLWCWGIFFRTKEWRKLLIISLGILIGIALGVIIDYWGYGTWTFTPWNYYQVNIVEDRAAGFGVDPWYYYITKSISRGIAPLSIPLIVGTLFFWFKKWNHSLTWLTLPFFIIHSLIGHKELRFLFPIMAMAPFMTYYMWVQWKGHNYPLSQKLFKFFIGLNLVLLIGTSFKAANSAFRFYSYIDKTNIREIYSKDEDPFTMVGLKLNFYTPKDMKVSVYKDINDLPKTGHFFFRSGQGFLEWSKKEGCELLYLSYPQWTLNFNIGNWVKRSRVWSLFQCKA